MAGELRPSVNQIRRLGNFSQMFRWGIKVVQFPILLPQWANSTQSFNIRAHSAGVPEKTGTSTDITIRGSRVRQPGVHEYTSPWSCSLYETNDTYVQQMLRDWHNLCWDTNLRNTAGDSRGWTEYKALLEGVIELYMLDNLDNPIYKYTLIGAYVESYARGDFDSDSADPMDAQLSLALDYFLEGPIAHTVMKPKVWSDAF